MSEAFLSYAFVCTVLTTGDLNHQAFVMLCTVATGRKGKKQIEKCVRIWDALMTIRWAYLCVLMWVHIDTASTSIEYACTAKKEHLFTHIFTRVKASIGNEKGTRGREGEREREKKSEAKHFHNHIPALLYIYASFLRSCAYFFLFLSVSPPLVLFSSFFGPFFIFTFVFSSVGVTLR